MTRILRRWPASSLVILAFLVTYGIGLPLAFLLRPVEVALGLRDELLSLWTMRWGPTIAGFIVLAAVAGRRSFRVWLTQLLRWRVAPGYYLFIYAGALALFAASIALAFGLYPPPASAFAASTSPAALMASWAGEIAYITLTNGEETGWRFVLLGLLLTRMRLFEASLLVGAAWVIWHLPMYLFLGGGGWPMFAPFIAVGLGLGLLLAWLYRATDSLLLPVLFHGAVNATTYTFERHFPGPAGAIEALGPTGDWMYAAALAPVVLVLLWMRRGLFFGPVSFRAGENWAQATRPPAP
jgi:membrane protease YdiL (CAAX protease family)